MKFQRVVTNIDYTSRTRRSTLSHTSLHPSQTSPPVVSVRSSSPVEPGTPAQSIAPDVVSVHSSHLSSAKPQSTSSSDDEETAKARMDAALAAQEVANQKLAYIRAKKKSSRASKASSVAARGSPVPASRASGSTGCRISVPGAAADR